MLWENSHGRLIFASIMKHLITYSICLLFLLFTACRQEEVSQNFTAKVFRGDFEHYLYTEGVVEPSQTVSVSCISELRWSTIQWIVEDGVFVQEGDVICVLDNTEYEENSELILEYLSQGRLNYESGVANLNAQYSQLEAQAKNIAIQARLSKLDSLQITYYTANQRKIAELNLRKNEIQQAKLQRQLATMKIVNEAELKRLEMQLRQYEELEQLYNYVMQNTIIKAPASGQILLAPCPSMTSRKLMSGDELRQDIGRIVVGNERHVRIEATEQDVKRMEMGQAINYTFSSKPGVKAFGSVLSKMPVSRPLSNGSQVNVFDVTAKIDSSTALLEPEISANCQVLLRSIPDTLIVPMVAVFDEDSARVVYVQKEKMYQRREVSIVAQSEFEAVVSSGLEEGEVLSLIKPKENKIIKE